MNTTTEPGLTLADILTACGGGTFPRIWTPQWGECPVKSLHVEEALIVMACPDGSHPIFKERPHRGGVFSLNDCRLILRDPKNITCVEDAKLYDSISKVVPRGLTNLEKEARFTLEYARSGYDLWGFLEAGKAVTPEWVAAQKEVAP